ncbi:hypothetical protein NQ176_g6943 [Zarea fungicola]|uniref:Uncharacterized protein n=1 Tax=Zarea fungicola TaxID=93591 RepID=A0ACC1N1T2_9HYPO|nr:hypothetical protein NQ176_g6943 [Lecanicillium fungicola]
MLRDGVLTGYFHASQHIRVVEVLMQSAARIIESLQIYAVKHLQILLDLFAPVLTDAFALAYAPAVLSAAKALHATILNCWPRFVGTPHAERIINLVARCWTNIHDTAEKDTKGEFKDIGSELTQTISLLAVLWKDSGEPVPTEKLDQVVGKAPHLKSLFKPLQQGASAAR